ncbi:MAG: tetratricopeptide repeat protein [Deltaproteobacteria bacterium]|nr:tetratricopeptide repeat protein [Deltaproteobacteria bacterium]
MSSRLKFLIASLFVALITFVVYLSSLQNGFVNWDDHKYVYENPNIRSIDPAFLVSFYFSNWHPLTMLSYALDYAVWGLNPIGYHLTNILFHTANTFLVFVLAVRLVECGLTLPTPPSPLFNKEGARGRYPLVAASVTALLFGIHPVHVESVAWVSERKDVLYAFFYLLCILTYLRYTREDSKKAVFYVLCLIFFILSLMSKAMAVTLPAVLLILDFYPLGRLRGESLKTAVVEKIPFIALGITASLLAVWAQGEALIPAAKLPIMARPIIATYTFLLYLQKVLFPFNLLPLYPYPRELVTIDYVPSMIIFAAISIYCIRSLKNRKLYFVVWFYYVISLLPVIGIIQVGSHLAADRYTYLPSLSLFLLAGLGIGRVFEGLSKKHYLAGIIGILVLLSGILIVKTIKQIGIWQDSITLWSHQIKLNQETVLGYNNRGQAYLMRGEYAKAVSDLEKAVELNPLHTNANYNLGVTYGKLGRLEDAIRQHQAAIRLSPNNPYYHSSLGSIYLKQMCFDEAVREYNAAIELNPNDPSYYNYLANTYYKMGRLDDAILEYQAAIKLKPDHYVYFNLGKAYLAKGVKDNAREAFEMALKLKPDFYPARQELALIEN